MTTLSSEISAQAGYDAWASSYDTVANATRDGAMALLRQQPFALDGAAVIELGCGTGLNTQWLAERAESVLGLDFSEGMLAAARERLDGLPVTLRQHDVTEPLPAAGESTDIVVETLVLEHVADLSAPFAEAYRVLRPGGVFFLCELHPFRQLVGKQARFAAGAGDQETHIEAYLHPVSEFINAGLDAGFQVGRAIETPNEADRGPRLFALTLVKPL